MTREELAKLGGNKVRKDNALFSLFKKYITEDAVHLFSSGKLPPGCFGCSFQSYYRKWSNFILSNQNLNINTMATKSKKTTTQKAKKTYELKDQHLKVYFDGKIIDKNSSDDDWIKWLKFIPEQTKTRELRFESLPDGYEPENLSTRDTQVNDEDVKTFEAEKAKFQEAKNGFQEEKKAFDAEKEEFSKEVVRFNARVKTFEAEKKDFESKNKSAEVKTAEKEKSTGDKKTGSGNSK